MNGVTFYLLAGGALFMLGLYGVLCREHLLRRLLALNITGNGVFLIFIATARRNGIDAADPVPQAMVLTGIVVAVCATAFGLALAERVARETGAAVLPRRGDSDGG